MRFSKLFIHFFLLIRIHSFLNFIKKFPIDGQYSEWTQWSECSASCNSGIKTRKRFCNSPATAFGGSFCYGHDQETKSKLLIILYKLLEG